jgi:hypothetical protein
MLEFINSIWFVAMHAPSLLTSQRFNMLLTTIIYQNQGGFMTRQTGLIATIATAVLVGCPSLCCCLFGIISVAGGGNYDFGDQTGQIDPLVGGGLVCLSLIGLVIPIAVWFFTLRGKPA